jgi:hypothetical protein
LLPPQAAHPGCGEDLVVKVYTRTSLQPLHLAQLLREVAIHSKAVHRWGSDGGGVRGREWGRRGGKGCQHISCS